MSRVLVRQPNRLWAVYDTDTKNFAFLNLSEQAVHRVLGPEWGTTAVGQMIRNEVVAGLCAHKWNHYLELMKKAQGRKEARSVVRTMESEESVIPRRLKPS